MNKELWVVFGLLLALALVAALPLSGGRGQERPVQVAEIVNQVEARPRPDDAWAPAAAGMEVYGGGQARTLAAGTAMLELLEGSVRLSADSVLTVRESVTRGRRLVTTLYLESGRVWVNLTTARRHLFTVQTPSAAVLARDTRFAVEVVDGRTLVSVAGGEVELTAQEQTVVLSAGQQAQVEPGQAPSVPGAADPDHSPPVFGTATPRTASIPLRVTEVTAGVEPSSFSGACPHQFEFAAVIGVDRAGPVRYRWERSDNTSSPEETLEFGSAGQQTVTTSWTHGVGGEHWARVRIISPNTLLSNAAGFTLECTTEPQTYSLDQWPDGTAISEDVVLRGDAFSAWGMTVEAVPGSGYCSNVVAAIRTGGGAIQRPYLTTALPGQVDACNTQPVRIWFANPVRDVSARFGSVNVEYLLAVYDTSGRKLGEVTEQGRFGRQAVEISYRSSSSNIGHIEFGRPGAITAIHSLTVQ